MKERPILFSAPMVRAILDGRKTQTRRVVKPQPEVAHWQDIQPMHGTSPDGRRFGDWREFRVVGPDWPDSRDDSIFCPYGQPGDRLWVKETWRLGEDLGAGWKSWMVGGTDRFVIYGADGVESYIDVPDDYAPPRNAREVHNDEGSDEHWRSFGPIPSLFMPRWASRITLEVTGVRVERLQHISGDDAFAEGVDTEGDAYCEGESLQSAGSPVSPERYAFATLWRSINGDDSWEANPWVWVVEFQQVTQ